MSVRSSYKMQQNTLRVFHNNYKALFVKDESFKKHFLPKGTNVLHKCITNSLSPLSEGYSIFWNYRWINVYRPDVLCTNGIIHVIDEPFLEDGDIRVTGGTANAKITLNIVFANLLMILIATLLL